MENGLDSREASLDDEKSKFWRFRLTSSRFTAKHTFTDHWACQTRDMTFGRLEDRNKNKTFRIMEMNTIAVEKNNNDK